MRTAWRATPMMLLIGVLGCGGSDDWGPPADDEVVLKVKGMV